MSTKRISGTSALVVGVLWESFVEVIDHYSRAELIKEFLGGHIPSQLTSHSIPGILIVIGAVILILDYFDRRRERGGVPTGPSMARLAGTPHDELRHNVGFVTMRRDEPTNSMVACFRNLPIPNKRVASLEYVRARVTFFDENKDEVLDVFPAAWIGEGEFGFGEPGVRFGVGETHCCCVATYTTSGWQAARIQKAEHSWGGGYAVLPLPIRAGKLTVTVTLIDEYDIAMEPTILGVHVGIDGKLSVTQPS